MKVELFYNSDKSEGLWFSDSILLDSVSDLSAFLENPDGQYYAFGLWITDSRGLFLKPAEGDLSVL